MQTLLQGNNWEFIVNDALNWSGCKHCLRNPYCPKKGLPKVTRLNRKVLHSFFASLQGWKDYPFPGDPPAQPQFFYSLLQHCYSQLNTWRQQGSKNE